MQHPSLLSLFRNSSQRRSTCEHKPMNCVNDAWHRYHSSKVEAFFGSCRYFKWRSKASCVSKDWFVTGDLNFPLTLMPTFSRDPSPDFAASLISILLSPDLSISHKMAKVQATRTYT